ncbi:hypothetical protein BEI_1969 [Halomonas beimenensis]|uniref:Uncharacterized protein n=1 Tax=Halomonas beimenensis TaxID=475662 RepID=A0A291P7S1_9GAMM|nr:hypothetical protein BEI_1969 [Halomonas beimenensis]
MVPLGRRRRGRAAPFYGASRMRLKQVTPGVGRISRVGRVSEPASAPAMPRGPALVDALTLIHPCVSPVGSD